MSPLTSFFLCHLLLLLLLLLLSVLLQRSALPHVLLC